MCSQDAARLAVEIKNLEADENHVHFVFKAEPITNLTRFVNVLKGASIRRICHEYENELDDTLWGHQFWSDSYCLISMGQVSLDVSKEYVENQCSAGDDE